MDPHEPLTEKLETLARLSASLSHKLANHLTYVLNYLFLLKTRAADDETRDLAVKAEKGLVRMKEVLHELVDIAHPRRGTLEDIALCSFLEGTLGTLLSDLKTRDIRLDISCPQSSTVRADRRSLATVIFNLIDNAAQAGASEIRIGVRAEDGRSVICIDDNGSGMDASEFERFSEPFVSGRPGSLGLGLSRSIFIIRSLGGAITCRAGRDGGTELSVFVPSGD